MALTTRTVVSGFAALAVAVSGCGPDGAANADRTPPSANAGLDEYLTKNGVERAIVHEGDRGVPRIRFPIPAGWRVVDGAEAPAAAWSAMALDGAALPPPTIVATLAGLIGGAPDSGVLLGLSALEIESLPHFDGAGAELDGEFNGFPASVSGGTFVHDGMTMLVARKSVLIPAADATYLLTLDVRGSDEYADQMMDATTAIDDDTEISVP